jgi:hypothetical protein
VLAFECHSFCVWLPMCGVDNVPAAAASTTTMMMRESDERANNKTDIYIQRWERAFFCAPRSIVVTRVVLLNCYLICKKVFLFLCLLRAKAEASENKSVGNKFLQKSSNYRNFSFILSLIGHEHGWYSVYIINVKT